MAATARPFYPGVVLIHGGGGTAFAEWAWLWAQRGYAAIAMDLSGHRPPTPIYDDQGVPIKNQAARRAGRERLEHGGLDQGRGEKFDSIGGDHDDDWTYHAVANVVRAHSLLRSFPEVDAQRTAVTGISWGGYTTCLVASVDRRFQAAAPVYGCGFLFEGESVQKGAIDRLGDRRQAWIEAYDPSSWLKQCQVPILFVNGSNDIHYPLDSYQKSFAVVPGSKKEMRIEVGMGHSHPAGWAPREIGWFIDSHCRGGKPLPRPGKLTLNGGRVSLQYSSAVPLKQATLHYTTDDGLRSKRKWDAASADVQPNSIKANVPPEANTWLISLTDQRGAMATTPVQFRSGANQ